MRTAKFIFLMGLLLGIVACSGGGNDSTSISSNSSSFASGSIALSVAEKVTVVDAKSDGISSSSVETKATPETGIKADLAPYDIPGGTPYYTDDTRVWVSERSAEVFRSVNSILCFISKLQYQAMLNRGDYVAQIDMKSCEDSTDASGRLSEGGQSSSEDEVPQYTRWVVNSSRADRTSPHIIKAWVEDKGDQRDPSNYGGLVYALITITESTSASNPLGIFRLDYGGHPYLSDGSLDTSTWTMQGFIRTYRDPATGEVLLNYVSDEDHGAEIRDHRAVLNRDEDAGEGIGSVYAKNSYENNGSLYTSEENFDFSYNDTHFLRGLYNSTNMNYDDQSCYSRYFFDEVVHSYGLYNSTGQRIENFSGLPLRYNDGSQNYYGWIGYYGMWFPDQVSLSAGGAVWSQEFDNGGNLVETPYEAFVSGGRLLKFTKGTVQLLDIGNVPLKYGEDALNPACNCFEHTDYIAIWNPATQTFQKTDIVDYDSGTTTDIPDVDIDLTGMYNITFWSDSLSSSLRVDLMNAAGGPMAPDNSTNAVTYTVSAVYPGTEDPALATNGLLCFENCPNATPGIINSSTPMYSESTDWSLSSQYGVLPASSGMVNAVTYSFDAPRMQLVDDRSGLDVVLDEPSPWNNGGSFQTGPMIINTSANVDSYLACYPGSLDLCSWKLWDNASVFYLWETGPDQWNRLSALKDPSSGNFVSFEPPIKVEYTHNDPTSKYFGSKFFLSYSGFGNLSGIPGECTDKDTGDPVPCGPDTWWRPSFSIPTGTELEDAGPDGVFGTLDDIPYLSKALEKEQKMKKTSTLLPCASFTLAHYTLPDISQWKAPLIGTMPTVTAPPRVIDGELL